MNKARMTFRLNDSPAGTGRGTQVPGSAPVMAEVKEKVETQEQAITNIVPFSQDNIGELGALPWTEFNSDPVNPFQNHSAMSLAPMREERGKLDAEEVNFPARREHPSDGGHFPNTDASRSIPADTDVNDDYLDSRFEYYQGGAEGSIYEEGPIYEDRPVLGNHTISRPPKRASGWKVFGSVTGAVVTGALFGLVVLSLFNKDIEFPIPGLTSVKNSAMQAMESLPAMGEIGDAKLSAAEEAEAEAKLPAIQISVPEQSYYFLQYGVFSTEEGVERATAELQATGLAAAKDNFDGQRVYAAISTDREQAKLLSSQLQADGVNLIVHQADIPQDAVVHFSKPGDTLEQYANQSAELVKLLSATSASLLLEDSPALSSEQLAGIKEQHVLFTQNAAAIRDGFAGERTRVSQNMESEMNTAVEALLQFDKTKVKSHLWEVQNAMMQFVLNEQQLFKGE